MRARAALPLVALAVLVVLPLGVQDSYMRHLMIVVFIYAMVAASWDPTLGYAGLFNFAHVAFFGTGVYATALAARLCGVDPWAAMVPGDAATSVVAGLVALPVVRLTGIHVVLVTFAVSQLILRVVISQSAVTGGTRGLVRIPTLELPGCSFLRDDKLGDYYVGLALLVVTVAGLRMLARSDFGLSLQALRDNEDYGVARGIPLARQRLKAMVASAFFAGLAGGLYAVYLRVASPEVFGFATSSLVLGMVPVGGVGTIWGPVIADFAPTLASECPATVPGPAEGRFMPVAVAMIVALCVLPGGVVSAAFRLPGRRKERRP